DEEAYAPVNMHDQDDPNDNAGYGGPRSDYSDPYRTGGEPTNYAAAASTVSSYHDNPFRQQEANPFDNADTSYHSTAAGGRYAPSPSPGPFEDARFPAANYDRIERP